VQAIAAVGPYTVTKVGITLREGHTKSPISQGKRRNVFIKGTIDAMADAVLRSAVKKYLQ